MDPRQHQSPDDGDDRFQGQYEKDPWRPNAPPGRARELPERRPRDAGDARRAERRSEDDEPYEPTEGYEPFEAGRAGRHDPVGEGIPERERPVERRYPPGPKGYQRSDERLREVISERLMEARDIDSSEVTVAVSGAKVVLEGTVPERRMKHAIEDLADACPGVQDIENRIRVQR
jgi:hypothetical protein